MKISFKKKVILVLLVVCLFVSLAYLYLHGQREGGPIRRRSKVPLTKAAREKKDREIQAKYEKEKEDIKANNKEKEIVAKSQNDKYDKDVAAYKEEQKKKIEKSEADKKNYEEQIKQGVEEEIRKRQEHGNSNPDTQPYEISSINDKDKINKDAITDLITAQKFFINKYGTNYNTPEILAAIHNLESISPGIVNSENEKKKIADSINSAITFLNNNGYGQTPASIIKALVMLSAPY